MKILQTYPRARDAVSSAHGLPLHPAVPPPRAACTQKIPLRQGGEIQAACLQNVKCRMQSVELRRTFSGFTARPQTALCGKRPQFAENFRLMRKSECGARINLRSPERRAAERKHDAEPPRGEHRVVSPNHGKKFCLFQNFFRELQSGFPSLSRKSQHLFCEICAKPGITRARKTTLFRCAPQFVANLRLFQERGSRGIL